MFRSIHISAVLNGYLVKVGCQRLVFNTPGQMLRELANYLEDPQSVEEHYTKNRKYESTEDGMLGNGAGIAGAVPTGAPPAPYPTYERIYNGRADSVQGSENYSSTSPDPHAYSTAHR